jgi:hypothetical protein
MHENSNSETMLRWLLIALSACTLPSSLDAFGSVRLSHFGITPRIRSCTAPLRCAPSSAQPPVGNGTAAPSDVPFKPPKLSGRRPIGVDDFVGGVEQGPDVTQEYSVELSGDDDGGLAFDDYDGGSSGSSKPASTPGQAQAGGVGGKIGLEKAEGLPGGAGDAFGISR